MKKSLFSSLLSVAVCAVSVASAAMLGGCSTLTGTPTDSQVAIIQNACAVDAGVRPTVTALLAIGGLATADETAAVTAARALIDPICANPSGSVQANALAVVTGATGQIVAIVTKLQARKAAAPPAAASSAS